MSASDCESRSSMASESPKVSLRLIIDEEKNKVVLAEAGKDFVEVLYSLLTLPMGTIVRLLQNSEPVTTIGCFSNLYKSVVDMKDNDFETEACKEMLVYPRSVGEAWCRTLKLNINPTEESSCFVCSEFSDCNACSYFYNSRCRCGDLTRREIMFVGPEKFESSLQKDVDGIFISGRSSFIVTDDLKLAVESTSSLLQTLKELGYADVNKLGEKVLDIGLQEVLTLLQCVFTSNAPLTDAFLKNQSPRNIYKTVNPCVEEKRDEGEAEKVMTFEAIVRKKDMKVLYVECKEDFVDLVFTFLAIPLQSTWEMISGNNNIITLGCFDNLCRSFKDLSGGNETKKCMLPYYYGCQKLLPNIVPHRSPVYLNVSWRRCFATDFGLNVNMGGSNTNYVGFGTDIVSWNTNCDTVRMALLDPRSDHSTRDGIGFVKRKSKFRVSDDLIVTPKNTTSTFWELKKLQVHADDLEVQEISIGKAEVLNLLRASLVTSSALSTAFKSLIAKKRKEEAVIRNSMSKKPKVET